MKTNVALLRAALCTLTLACSPIDEENPSLSSKSEWRDAPGGALLLVPAAGQAAIDTRGSYSPNEFGQPEVAASVLKSLAQHWKTHFPCYSDADAAQ